MGIFCVTVGLLFLIGGMISVGADGLPRKWPLRFVLGGILLLGVGVELCAHNFA